MPETELDDELLNGEDEERKRAAALPQLVAPQPATPAPAEAIGSPITSAVPTGTPSEASLGKPILPPSQPAAAATAPEIGAVSPNTGIGSMIQLTPQTPSMPLTGRPNYDAYQTQLHNKAGVQNVHGFGGGLLRTLDAVGSAIMPNRMAEIPGTTIHHQGDINRAAKAAGVENQEITSQSEEQLRQAQADEQRALAAKNANPAQKLGMTPEETTIHDLMTGENGQPRVNPDTQKPYTYLEAYQALQQSKQGAKPEKTPNDFEQYYKDFLTENHFPDTAHNRLLAREHYAAAGQTPQRPQQQLAIGPDNKVVELKPGTTVAPGTKTVSGDLGTAKQNNDEQRRADLANNLNENLDKLEEIVKRRPDLFGPGAGRLTSARQWLGTGDPDVAALANIKEQVGLAMVGAHAMRNAQHAEKAADSILNAYKNEPSALLGDRGSIATARNSLKTFISDVEGQRVQDKDKGKQGGGAQGGTHNFTLNGKPYQNVPDDLYKKYKDKPGFKE